MLLAADIGGTWARLLATDSQGRRRLASDTYASADFASLADVINTFRQQHGLPAFAAACLGLPGPVVQERSATLTNLPWAVEADKLEAECGIGQVVLINDFQAAAYGINCLTPGQLLTLHPGQPAPGGHRLVAGAGTGLGVAPVLLCNGRYVPVASEGGHMDFAPADDMQQDLLRWLWQQWEHVSCERILSGPGLELLYGFFSGLPHPGQAAGVSAAQVSAMAAAGEPVACRTLSTFVSIYGSYLGNVALLWPAPGGIYIAGGVAAHISDWMQRPEFLQALQNKGRMRAIINRMPVYLVIATELGLTGAACLAHQLVTSSAGE
ncbi:MAG: glucokinase [Thiopseudomonas sp.]|jgi:glucokinase